MPEALFLVSLGVSLTALALTLYLYRRCLNLFAGRFDVLNKALSSKSLKAYVRISEAREKRKLSRRYMILKVVGGSPTLRIIQGVIEEGIRKLFGASSISLIQPRVLYYNARTGKAVLRFRAAHKWRLLASLGLSEGLSNPLVLIPLRTTGTLMKARRHADSIN